jgi:hypothetical protein
MKKVTLFTIIALVTLSSCTFQGYMGCPAYSGQNKTTKHGLKAQSKYVKRSGKKHHSLI